MKTAEHEKRLDCDSFEMKRYESDRGDCQTDGHYLCTGCRHIADFDWMEESDNRMRYYHEQEKQAIEAEKMKLEADEEVS